MRIPILIATLLVSLLATAQAPQAFDFQGVARDAFGNVKSSESITLRISILVGSPGGDVAYQELHSVTTSPFGLFSIAVGQGTPTESTFPAIGWGASSHFIQVEMDASGGSDFQNMGTTQLLSVPYALHARAVDCFSVSLLGDTLKQGNGCFVIIPGISAANGGCQDLDGDGVYDNPGCSDPIDCDDNDPTVYPGAPELCGDGKDNDCDGEVDNNPDMAAHLTWYLDADDDGYGDPDISQVSCARPSGYVGNGDDCDDSDPLRYPGQGCSELCSAEEQAWIDQNQYNYLRDYIYIWALDQFNQADLAAWIAEGQVDGSMPISLDCHQCAQQFVECVGLQSCLVVCLQSPEACYQCFFDNTPCLQGFINCTGLTDADGDGYVSGSDCDDADPSVTIGATWYRDLDGDGYGDHTNTVVGCTQPAGFVDNPYDCDDTDPEVYFEQGCPGIECGFAYGQQWGACGNSPCVNGYCQPCADLDGDGWTNCDGDCDDNNPDVYPGATEQCNGIDDNCDGQIDEGACQGSEFCSPEDATYIGNDQVAFLNAVYARSQVNQSFCINNPPYAQCQIENLAAIFPTGTLGVSDACQECAVEYLTCYYTYCHGNSCLGALNTECVSCLTDYGCLSQFIACVGLVDNDGDGWASGSDCNDDVVGIHPFAPEICNGLDDNCNGQVDEGASMWYPDLDGDGYGVFDGAIASCDDPGPGYAPWAGDCDDEDPEINPGVPELCNGIDDDCDGEIDENPVDGQVWYRDADGDGYGDIGSTEIACSMPPGYVANNIDCDDTNAMINPARPELCNGIDDNCDGQIDEGACANCTDGIKNGTETDVDCGGPDCPPCAQGQGCDLNNDCGPGLVCQGGTCLPECPDADGDGWTTCAGDCDDNNPNVYPGAFEICNGIDDNCDGQIDEGACANCTDGIKNGAETDVDCGGPDCPPCAQGQGCDLNNDCGPGLVCQGGTCQPECPDADGDGWTTCAGDCDDNNPNVYPGAFEFCNGIDDNCDGQIDEGACANCTDGIKNGTETDVDCGGPDCPPCAQGQGCDLNSDCGPGLICENGVCVPL
ncbi:MAG: putative metal-binding motif-containing protein [Flavobacteriales bacterium]|nr:putative metal-binding motif-containing protein [Flavobacteriales bacterium]